MEPFKPHENLADEVNKAIVDSQLHGGVDLRELAVGRKLHIYFRAGYYLLDHRTDGFFMSEHLFNGKTGFWNGVARCVVVGSLFHRKGTMVRMGWVGRGMFLEFHLNDGPRLTSSAEILEIQES